MLHSLNPPQSHRSHDRCISTALLFILPLMFLSACFTETLLQPSDGKALTSFAFLASTNEKFLENDVVGIIDE